MCANEIPIYDYDYDIDAYLAIFPTMDKIWKSAL